jgi:hypothetical protein
MTKNLIPFNENYYKYKEEADKVREKYGAIEKLNRKEWLELYKEIMDVITYSKDWHKWMWEARNNLNGISKNRYTTTEPFIGWLNGNPLDGVFIKKKKTAVSLGLPQASVSQLLLGYIKQSSGYTFKYLCDMDEDEIRNELEARGQSYDEWRDRISKL